MVVAVIRNLKKFLNDLQSLREGFIHSCQEDSPGLVRVWNYSQSVLQAFQRIILEQDVSRKDWALVAVGGFGRLELSFYSDLDLLFLYRKKMPKVLEGVVKELCYGLWDLQFEVGYTVSSLKGVDRLVSENFATQTSYLETRFVVGDKDFYDQWRTKFLKPLGPRQKKSFLQLLLEHRKQRFEKFGESIYLLEPHLKEGLGGLRDIHLLKWAAGIFFGRPELSLLHSKGWLSDEERFWLEEALDFLWRVRLQLHALTERKQDRLLLADQVHVARRLGFEEGPQFQMDYLGSDESNVVSNGNDLAAEAFMRLYYRHTARVRRTAGFVLERLAREFSGQTVKRQRKKVLPGPLLLQGDRIFFQDPDLISGNPRLLMDIFWQASQWGAHFQHETGQIIREHLGDFPEELRSDPDLAGKFFQILSNFRTGADILKVMLETGFLEAYLPEFSAVRYRVQHDVYHLYTVDEHLLRTVSELQSFFVSGLPELESRVEGQKFTEIRFSDGNQDLGTGAQGGLKCKALGVVIPKVKAEVLFLAALVHDIGKGRGKDHCLRGAVISRAMGQRLGLCGQDLELLSFLVLNHVFLVEWALKRDLSDEKVIEAVALHVGSREKLLLLLLLSLADSKATGPQAWNAWRRSLIFELFFKVAHFLGQEGLEEDLKQQVLRIKENVLALIIKQDQPVQEEARRWVEQLTLRYLLSMSPGDICRHFFLERDPKASELLLECRLLPGGLWEMVVICPDQQRLFDLLTGVLWVNGINILAANIYTRAYNLAVDVLILDQISDPLHAQELWQRVETDLRSVILGEKELKDLLNATVRKKRHSRSGSANRQDRVVISEEASDFYTVIEVYTWERPGVLHLISTVLHDFGLNIKVAKISTPGAQVVDVFYVTDDDGNKIMDQGIHEKLTTSLLAGLQTL